MEVMKYHQNESEDILSGKSSVCWQTCHPPFLSSFSMGGKKRQSHFDTKRCFSPILFPHLPPSFFEGCYSDVCALGCFFPIPQWPIFSEAALHALAVIQAAFEVAAKAPESHMWPQLFRLEGCLLRLGTYLSRKHFIRLMFITQSPGYVSSFFFITFYRTLLCGLQKWHSLPQLSRKRLGDVRVHRSLFLGFPAASLYRTF